MVIKRYFIYLWDEFNIFGKKGISLQANAEEDPESNPRGKLINLGFPKNPSPLSVRVKNKSVSRSQ